MELMLFFVMYSIAATSAASQMLSIDDIHLNTRLKEAKQYYNFSDIETYYPTIGREAVTSIVREYYASFQRDGYEYSLSFTTDKRLFALNKHRYYDGYTPNWNSIKNKVFDRFGQPIRQGSTTNYVNGINYFSETACWGDCTTEPSSGTSGEKVKCKENADECLKLWYSRTDKDKYSISLSLVSPVMKKESDRKVDSQLELIEAKKKQEFKF